MVCCIVGVCLQRLAVAALKGILPFEACLLQSAVDVVELALCLLRVDGEGYGFNVVVIHKKSVLLLVCDDPKVTRLNRVLKDTQGG